MKKSSFLSKVLTWMDSYLLLSLATFLIAFIPLFPKIPIFSPIEQYIVRVRLEDFVVLFAFLFWLLQIYRRKIEWKNIFFWPIIAYIIAGGLSLLSAMTITQTILLEPLHVGKSLLHYFRYIEYFTLFFIVYSAIKTTKHVYMMLATGAITVVALSIYGYGQKYYYWPVYSTMNREFSKGVRLYLTEHARVQSTFAGHYDLGAYLVIVLPIVLAFALSTSNKILKIVLHAVHWSGLWLLVVSASRTSFIGYLGAVGLVILLLSYRKKNLKESFGLVIKRSIVVGSIIVLTFAFFGEDIYERLLQVLAGYPKTNAAYHELNKQRKIYFNDTLPLALGLKKPGEPTEEKSKPTPPPGAISTEDAMIIVSSDTRPTPVKPLDVYVDVPDYVEVATTSADGTVTTTIVEKDRTFSENAQKYGLSTAIRLDSLWPWAIQGFKRNPVFGTGYATLNKQSAQQFTEADSTDNNFLRTLGETGLVGFITFYGVVVIGLYLALKHLQADSLLARTMSAGYIAGTLGLLVNAVFIDVFAASKVAFTFWATTGLLAAIFHVSDKEHVPTASGSGPANDVSALALAFKNKATPQASQNSKKHKPGTVKKRNK